MAVLKGLAAASLIASVAGAGGALAQAAAPVPQAQTASPDQATLATMTPEQLRAQAQARIANPNRPTGWWAETVSQQPDAWYRTPEGLTMTANILSWQDSTGGWPLMNTTRELNRGDPAQAGPWGSDGALIKATVNEMRFLARAYRATGDARDLAAVRRGLGFILMYQYPTGGWPHSVPPPEGYERYATFNDDMIVDVMTLLGEVANGGDFASLPEADRQAAKGAFDKALDFILKTQIVVDGKRTAWAQQYDEVTLEPRAARRFEPVAISGGESVGVLLLLMSLDHPSPEVRRAVREGADWFDRSRLSGIRFVRENGDGLVRSDPDAPPLWARYYEIGTNRPIFAGRDGIIRYDLAEVEQERRGGYGWYSPAGAQVLTAYAQWRQAHPQQ
ncbi:pectate lyase [Brevundimonas goettingensis]|uniref:Pectate lyase n=1 Tax=Brevundimonas goettingensis TaxID=2774190 RepID=A0A975C371_9CAUL|nr:pectate lyase [Brevundimonas goettingensis]QTC92027.1 pectate lyase [Brevundimonas goettingensis]